MLTLVNSEHYAEAPRFSAGVSHILSDIPSLSDDVLVVLMHVIAIMSSVEYDGDNDEFNNMLHDRLLFNAVIDDVIHHGMPVEYAMEHVKMMEN